jgi:hypothetical protein
MRRYLLKGEKIMESSEILVNSESTAVSVDNNVNGDDVTSQKSPTGSKSSTADDLVRDIANAVSQLGRSADRNNVKRDVTAILNLVFAVNSLGEYETGVRVGGDLYRIDEYVAPAAIAKLVVGRRVVLRDVVSSKDFLERERFVVTAKKLPTPGEFKAAVKRVSMSLRTNPTLQALSRPDFKLLADEAAFAVNRGRVSANDLDHIIYLKGSFDEEQRYLLSDWILNVADSLFA